MPEELDPRELFIKTLQEQGFIESYEMSSVAAAVVKVKWPVSYLRIEVVQEKCRCGCVDNPDHGPCHNFQEGANGRCVYCDHAKACHNRVTIERFDETSISERIVKGLIGGCAVCEDCEKKLQDVVPYNFVIHIEKIADFIDIKALWCGVEVGFLRVREEQILGAITEPFSKRVDEFCAKVAGEVGTDKLTARAARCAISSEVNRIAEKLR